MTEPHIYTPTAEFAKTWEENEEKRQEFVARVVRPWNTANPDLTIAWINNPFDADPDPVGFMDAKPGEPVPTGLSRRKNRKWLIPVPGTPGEQYRAVLAQMRKMPSRTKVMERFGIPPRVRAEYFNADGSHSNYLVQPHRFNGTWYVGCAEPIESKSLTPAKLSDYYRDKEAHEAAKAAEAATS